MSLAALRITSTTALRIFYEMTMMIMMMMTMMMMMVTMTTMMKMS